MNGPKKILILSSSHLCRNPRVVKEATTLGAAGYDVTVMSISVQRHFEERDRALLRGLPFKRLVLDYAADTLTARLSSFCSATTAADPRATAAITCRSIPAPKSGMIATGSTICFLRRPAELMRGTSANGAA